MASTPAERRKKYREAHPDRVKEQIAEWRKANPERVSGYNQKTWKLRRESPGYETKKRSASRLYNQRVKLQVLSHYGPAGEPRCSWLGCEVSDIDMLTLDHLGDGGNCDRRNTGKGGGCATYSYLRSSGFPDGFQTLCMNHQLKKDILRRRGGVQGDGPCQWNWPPRV